MQLFIYLFRFILCFTAGKSFDQFESFSLSLCQRESKMFLWSLQQNVNHEKLCHKYYTYTEKRLCIDRNIYTLQHIWVFLCCKDFDKMNILTSLGVGYKKQVEKKRPRRSTLAPWSNGIFCVKFQENLKQKRACLPSCPYSETDVGVGTCLSYLPKPACKAKYQLKKMLYKNIFLQNIYAYTSVPHRYKNQIWANFIA